MERNRRPVKRSSAGDVAGRIQIPLLGTINVTDGTNRILIGGPDTLATLIGAIKYIFTHPRHAFSWQPGGGRTGAILLSPLI